MHKVFLLVVAALLFVINAAAQEQPKLEVFGGYSLERIAPCGTQAGGCGYQEPPPFPASNFNGWNASLTRYVYKSLGVTADFGGHYSNVATGVNFHRYSYLFGPVYAFHSEKSSAFVHALFGAISEGEAADLRGFTYFAWAVGGGVDVKVSRLLSVRPVQLDYERSSVPGLITGSLGVNGFRYSGGVVFKF
jgi:hypothetical protein